MAKTMESKRVSKSMSQRNEPTMVSKKLTADEARKRVRELEIEVEKLNEKLKKYEGTSYCPMCKKHKDIETKFYLDTDPKFGGHSPSRICKDCAKKIALRVDANGDEHNPTRDSVISALKALNKPFLNNVWDSSIQESENLITGKIKTNVWTSYVKNIAMGQYVGRTYEDSDMFKQKIVYDDEKTVEEIVKSHESQDTYDDFVKNKNDVVRLLGYDPFEREAVIDQPLLYSQLLGMIDAGGDANDDMVRTASCISIVRNFSQQAKIDDAITKLMGDYTQLKDNSATIKSLQDSKQKVTSMIKDMAAESCISLKNNKGVKRGDNSWTGKIKKIRDLNLREGEINGFDVWTCKGMKQVIEMSDASIMKQLNLDESELTDMISEQRVLLRNVQEERDNYKEISRILLRENLDLKDFISENDISIDMNVVDLDELYSCFADDTELDTSEIGDNDEDES